jgi:hypothetical protein
MGSAAELSRDRSNRDDEYQSLFVLTVSLGLPDNGTVERR